MKRTTISIPDDLASALQREARRCGVPVSQVAREALEVRLGRTPGTRRRLPFVALGRSGYRDTSEQIEEILRAEWTRDRHR